MNLKTIFLYTAVSLCLSFKLQAGTWWFFDFDGTLISVYNTGDLTEGFKSYFKLIKISPEEAGKHSNKNTGPEFFIVSTDEFDRIASKTYNPKNAKEGNKELITLESGQKIKPWFYKIDKQQTFEDFGRGPNGENFLLIRFKEAYEKNPEAWKAKAMIIFQALTSQAELAPYIGINTARRHYPDQWLELFQHWRKLGLIQNIPNLDLVWNMNNTEFSKRYPQKNTAQRKATSLEEFIREKARLPLTSEDLRLDQYGKELKRLHEFHFYEDNLKYIKEVTETFERLSREEGLKDRIKLVLHKYNYWNHITGPDSFGNITVKAERPNVSIFTTDNTRTLQDISDYAELLGLSESQKQRASPELKKFIDDFRKNNWFLDLLEKDEIMRISCKTTIPK